MLPSFPTIILNVINTRRRASICLPKRLLGLTNGATSYNLSRDFDSKNVEALAIVTRSMPVIDDFVSEGEEASLIEEIEPYMKRLRYESAHWDDAIHQYRETEKLKWTPQNEQIINRIRKTAFPPGTKQIKHVHVLDLAKEGHIKPHVDSVKVGIMLEAQYM